MFDSESGTTIQRTRLTAGFCFSGSPAHAVPDNILQVRIMTSPLLLPDPDR